MIDRREVEIRDPDVDKELHDIQDNGEDPREDSPAGGQGRAAAKMLEVGQGMLGG